jgi:hypothetical protein
MTAIVHHFFDLAHGDARERASCASNIPPPSKLDGSIVSHFARRLYRVGRMVASCLGAGLHGQPLVSHAIVRCIGCAPIFTDR